MRSFKEIKHDYRFAEEDEKLLAELRPLMEENVEEIMSTLSLWIKGTKGAVKFFTEETLQRHVFATQKQWFMELFSGNYDNRFYEKLIRIGSIHVKQAVDVHYMHRAVNIIRNSCIGILQKTDDHIHLEGPAYQGVVTMKD